MSVPTEITRIKGLRDDIRSRLIQIGALSDANADLEACRDAMANVSTLMLDHIAITTPPDKDTYSPGETFDPTGMIVTAYFVFGDTVINFNVDDYTYPTEPLELGTDEVTISYSFLAVTKTAVQEIGTLDIEEDLDDNSWETISYIAKRGLGSTYWNIGDRKAITLGGKIGQGLTLTNVTLYVYILDFNHPENGVPDNNIIFGGFFTAKTGGKDVCLVDAYYEHDSYYYNFRDKNAFNINHNQRDSTNYIGTDENGRTYTGVTYSRRCDNDGGWKGCDLRYDILGGTNYQPSQYRYEKRSSANTGYDATQEAITNPVSNSLMAALPSEFRNVLRLRTHYTDNIGDAQPADGVDRYVTPVTDAISLLTEVEVFGDVVYSQPYEGKYQTQMAYYANGGSPTKYKHNDTNTAAIWWLASPHFNNGSSSNTSGAFVTSASAGTVSYKQTDYAIGIAPVFKI